MRVLITSGGTKVPIDSVRDITNMSRGTFGSKIARQFLMAGHDVTLFRAKGSRSPFKFEWDFVKQGVGHQYIDCLEFYRTYRENYSEREFRNFGDYESGLWELLGGGEFDIVLLAAAVSDYGVVPVDGKIRSGSDLRIDLFPYPKLISRVRERCPDVCLVGFKLLVGGTDEQLRDAVLSSIAVNDCDLVVGNDLSHIRANRHTLYLGSKRSGDVDVFVDDVFVDGLDVVVMKRSVAERAYQVSRM